MDLGGMSEQQRREKQMEAGLEFLPVMELSVSDATSTKAENGNHETRDSERTQARRVLHRLAQEESFWGIALHELKRAAVTVPIFATAALGVLWVNKKWLSR